MARLSVTTVIPAYNEGPRLSAFLRDWVEESAAHSALDVSAIVVVDGSGPGESAEQRKAVDAAAAALQRGGGTHQIRLHRVEQNQGKGNAIRCGWSLADRDAVWLSFIDADGAVPAREYWRLASLLPDADVDVVCGSRQGVEGRSTERTAFRRLQSRTFAAFVEALFGLGLHDSQCGLKFFRAARLRPVLPALTEEGWLLDVEVLARLKQAGARWQEVPIDCHERGGSKLVFGLDPIRMAAGLLSLRARLRRAAGGHR